MMAATNTRRRIILFKRNPHCFWCGKLTVFKVSKKLKHDTATVDHLYSRLHPERYTKRRRAMTVLACNQCNRARGQAEVKGLRFVPLLASRSAFAEMTSSSPLGAKVFKQGQPRKPIQQVAPVLSCQCYHDYCDGIRNAPDWPSTQRLMQNFETWLRDHRCPQPAVKPRIIKRAKLATIGELIGYSLTGNAQ